MSIERPRAHKQEEFDFNAPRSAEMAETFEAIPPGTRTLGVIQIETGDVIRMSKEVVGGVATPEEDAYIDLVVEASKSSLDGDWSLQFKGEKLPRHFDRDTELFVVQK